MTTTTTASASTRNAALWIDTDGTIGVGDIGFLIESTDNNRRGAVKYRLDSEPRCTNQSLQPRLTGWCGETNNVSVYAMGLRRVSKLTKDGRALLARLADAERDEWLRANGYESLIPLSRLAQLRPVPSREGRAFRRHGDQANSKAQVIGNTVDGGTAPRGGTRAAESVGQRHAQDEDRRAESEARQHRGRAGGRDHSARTRSVAVGSTYVDLLVSGSIVAI